MFDISINSNNFDWAAPESIEVFDISDASWKLLVLPAATKAAAELLINSYSITFQSDVIITRCTNNYGPRQFYEKLIPKTIIRAAQNLKIPLYGDGNQIRSWIHADDHVNAIQSLIQKGKSGDVYNITAYEEIHNKNYFL